MIIEGYIKKLLVAYNAIYSTAFITLDNDGFTIHSDTNDVICTTLGGFKEFLEGEIKEALFNMFINGQFAELRDVIEECDSKGGDNV